MRAFRSRATSSYTPELLERLRQPYFYTVKLPNYFLCMIQLSRYRIKITGYRIWIATSYIHTTIYNSCRALNSEFGFYRISPQFRLCNKSVEASKRLRNSLNTNTPQNIRVGRSFPILFSLEKFNIKLKVLLRGPRCSEELLVLHFYTL